MATTYYFRVADFYISVSLPSTCNIENFFRRSVLSPYQTAMVRNCS